MFRSLSPGAIRLNNSTCTGSGLTSGGCCMIVSPEWRVNAWGLVPPFLGNYIPECPIPKKNKHL